MNWQGVTMAWEVRGEPGTYQRDECYSLANKRVSSEGHQGASRE